MLATSGPQRLIAANPHRHPQDKKLRSLSGDNGQSSRYRGLNGSLSRQQPRGVSHRGETHLGSPESRSSNQRQLTLGPEEGGLDAADFCHLGADRKCFHVVRWGEP